MKISPAEHVIRTFGGVRATARALHRTSPAISKWRSTKAKRGTGGAVPGGAHLLILELAKKKRLDITPIDLILGRIVKQA